MDREKYVKTEKNKNKKICKDFPTSTGKVAQMGSGYKEYADSDVMMSGPLADRQHYYDIIFTKPFENVPKVITNIVSSTAQENNRLSVFAENITKTGFKLKIHTWWNTKIKRVEYSWIAYG